MTKLAAGIRAVLPLQSARWYDGLAQKLADRRWRCLSHKGIDPATYGTLRVLRANPAAPRLATVLNHAGFQRTLLLEQFDTNMLARYGILGLREPRNLDRRQFEAALAGAMALLEVVPAVGTAARALVWSITAVEVEGPDYDTGYSDPAVPFSIFIGAHRGEDGVPAIRLAEGVLHEVMHLQLSLIEAVVPLVGGDAERRHSPWQDRRRPTQGLLHGLYVFRVVQDWLGALMDRPGCSESEVAHARTRIAQIDAECAELANLAASIDFTSDGITLANALTASACAAGPGRRAG